MIKFFLRIKNIISVCIIVFIRIKGDVYMIGIIGAMDIEVNGITEKMTDTKTRTISGVRFVSGKLGNKECVVAKCGIGKVNAAITAQTMILEFSPDKIINTGIAGSTSNKTHIGYIVISDSVIQHDMDTTILGDKPGTLFLPDGTVTDIPCSRELIADLEKACIKTGEKNYIIGKTATGDQFISGNDKRSALNEKFGAVACEMEGGSIGQVCYVNKVPFAVLRSISDSMSDEDDAVEYSVFSRSAAEKAINIITALVYDEN